MYSIVVEYICTGKAIGWLLLKVLELKYWDPGDKDGPMLCIHAHTHITILKTLVVKLQVGTELLTTK